jgi:hypothetical protein
VRRTATTRRPARPLGGRRCSESRVCLCCLSVSTPSLPRHASQLVLSLLPARLRTDAPEGSKPSGSEVDPDTFADKDKNKEIDELKRAVRKLQQHNSELSQLDAGQPPHRNYLDTPVLDIFSQRFPWLLSLMLFQSVSGWVIEHFQGLIERHIILAAFLTMLVGGGGNSSGQTVAELVKRLGRGELGPTDLPQVLAKEVAVGTLLSIGLAVGAYPRVRMLSSHATDLDALATQRVESPRKRRLWGAAAGHFICKPVRCLVRRLVRCSTVLSTALPPAYANVAHPTPRRSRCRTCSSSSWAMRSGCSSR